MATISNTPRPGYVFDVTDNVWYPIGTGSHNHSEIATTIVDAKGDLIAATGADAVSRLAVGANTYILTADSSEAVGMKWAAPAGGGKVLQVVQGTLTSNVSTSSPSLVDTNLTVSITPSSATSKIYVAANLPEISAVNTASATGVAVGLAVLRGATKLQDGLFGIFGQASSSNKEIYSNISFSYLDSPATTSSTTYKVQYVLNTGTTAFVNASATKIASIIVFEIGA